MAFIKKSLIILFSLLSCGFLFYVFYSQVVKPIAFPAANPPEIPKIFTAATKMPEVAQAQFLIFTNGTRRIFTDPKYHNRSEDIYITAESPGTVVVKKPGATWGDFFASLPEPMNVTEDCLTTGTGQRFCTNDTAELSFYLNGKHVTGILGNAIQNGDKLLISYGTGQLIDEQQQNF